MWYFFCNARSKNIPLTGQLLQEQALIYSMKLNLDDFTASNGWLEAFQKHHWIKSAVLSGEASDVSLSTVESWKKCQFVMVTMPGSSSMLIKLVCFIVVPSWSLVAPGDTWHWGKVAKERITVLVACWEAGEKLQLLVISRSNKPRCIQSVATGILPVSYKANKWAWMTSVLFMEWLNKINNEMIMQQQYWYF